MIQGLNDLPEGWPELPANASLAADLGWVQANRLRIVEERMGKATRVRLDLALGPAPPWASLSLSHEREGRSLRPRDDLWAG